MKYVYVFGAGKADRTGEMKDLLGGKGAGLAEMTRIGLPVPAGFTTFPDEIWAAPRSWVETVYPGLAYFNEAERGGHFAAWEQPGIFVRELRASFKTLR